MAEMDTRGIRGTGPDTFRCYMQSITEKKGMALETPVTEPSVNNVSLAGIKNLSQEDRAFHASAILQARELVADWLDLLIHYDTGLSVDDARILCDAKNAIARAGDL